MVPWPASEKVGECVPNALRCSVGKFWTCQGPHGRQADRPHSHSDRSPAVTSGARAKDVGEPGRHFSFQPSLDRVPARQAVLEGQQTKARIFQGDSRSEGKIVSLFEPSAEVIRKGKASKPTEFGKLVKLQEAENQIIVDYEVFVSSDTSLIELQARSAALGYPRHLASLRV
jgi:hypothetical protein